MDRKIVRALLIEDSPFDAKVIRRALEEGGNDGFALEQAGRLSAGLQRLAQGNIDVLLLDLTLPDSQGFATFEAAYAAAGEIPILVLTGLDDESLAVRAVRAGAQDYLTKEAFAKGFLPRALRHAIERKEIERQLRRALAERLQTEERMRILGETLETLLAASPLAVVTFDTENRVTLWNQAAERTFGWTAAEVLGRPLPFVPEDKLEEHRSLRESVLAGRGFTGVETRRRDRHGAPLDLRISAAPLCDAHGGIRGIVEFLEDINDRKRAEQAIRRLASMPEQSPEPLVELDLAGNALYVNQAARSRFPDLQALGSVHPALANLASTLARFRHGERKSFSFEINFAQRIYHQMVYYVADGSLVRVFLSDVTEQRRAGGASPSPQLASLKPAAEAVSS